MACGNSGGAVPTIGDKTGRGSGESCWTADFELDDNHRDILGIGDSGQATKAVPALRGAVEGRGK